MKINYISVKTEGEEQEQIYAALDLSEYNRQFTVLEDEEEYEERDPDGNRADFEDPGEAAP